MMNSREFFNAIVNGQVTVTSKNERGISEETTINLMVDGGINPILIEYAQNELAKLDARKEKKKTTKNPTQIENEEIKAKIKAWFTENPTSDGLTAKETVSLFELASVQKASALMKQLTDEGFLKVTEVKAGSKMVKNYSKN